ncbi:DUF4174 domain-containing protein [Cobetia sp. L2A1]|uniref:DUF4174 domain-containing protein n=1 Tax=Cobetia sp. L2A1 TaxID=2686360 RepID=UPI00131CDD85|nr:DUF4174 domain-containing protein [Cobetia sp. L2A1]
MSAHTLSSPPSVFRVSSLLPFSPAARPARTLFFSSLLGMLLVASPQTHAISLLDSDADLKAPAETSAGAPSTPAPPATVETTMTASNVDPAANPLLGETWNRRSLILVAPDEHDRDLQQQRDALDTTRGDMQQRDMTTYTLMGTQGMHDGVPMSFEEVRALRDAMQLREGAPFTVILMGKDGGKKMQQEGFVSPDQIYQVIDNMPMRQREESQTSRASSPTQGTEEYAPPTPVTDEDWQWKDNAQ